MGGRTSKGAVRAQHVAPAAAARRPSNGQAVAGGAGRSHVAGPTVGNAVEDDAVVALGLQVLGIHVCGAARADRWGAAGASASTSASAQQRCRAHAAGGSSPAVSGWPHPRQTQGPSLQSRCVACWRKSHRPMAAGHCRGWQVASAKRRVRRQAGPARHTGAHVPAGADVVRQRPLQLDPGLAHTRHTRGEADVVGPRKRGCARQRVEAMAAGGSLGQLLAAPGRQA